jgi:hypothetical protein
MMKSIQEGRNKVTTIFTYAPVWAEGQLWKPNPGDQYTLKMMQWKRENQVSFTRAYRGWRASSPYDVKEDGEGRSLLRWLQRHNISIFWEQKDLSIDPFFCDINSPQHDPSDELAKEHSFVIPPLALAKRKIKLYVEDRDMLKLINQEDGEEEDFITLLKEYIELRLHYEKLQMPAPRLLDWVRSIGKRPLFKKGQVGLHIPLKWA